MRWVRQRISIEGRFVDDIGVSEEGWSDWLAGERQRFQELALSAMVGLGEKELVAGRADHALKAGHRASALNNMREDAHRLIMQALSATGRKAGSAQILSRGRWAQRELNEAGPGNLSARR